jgi:hypothetical protein
MNKQSGKGIYRDQLAIIHLLDNKNWNSLPSIESTRIPSSDDDNSNNKLDCTLLFNTLQNPYESYSLLMDYLNSFDDTRDDDTTYHGHNHHKYHYQYERQYIRQFHYYDGYCCLCRRYWNHYYN